MKTKLSEFTTVFRCDSSQIIGSGHASRCITLSRELLNRGMNIIFISRELDELSTKILNNLDIKIYNLSIDNQQWTQENEANLMLKILKEKIPDKKKIIVVDSYGLDSEWETIIKKDARLLLSFDDLGIRNHNSHVILNHNAIDVDVFRNKYFKNSPDVSTLLLGKDYTLIDEKLKKINRESLNNKNKKYTISVCFGGSDPQDLSARIFKILKGLEFKCLIVIGPMYEGKLKPEIYDNIEIIKAPENLFSLLSNASISIGSGGVMAIERCAAGIPSILINFVDNQRPMANFLNKEQCAYYIGDINQLTDEMIAQRIKEIVNNHLAIDEMKRKCLNYFDFNGSSRVSDFLIEKSLKH